MVNPPFLDDRAPQIAVQVHDLPGPHHRAVLPNAPFPEALTRARLGLRSFSPVALGKTIGKSWFYGTFSRKTHGKMVVLPSGSQTGQWKNPNLMEGLMGKSSINDVPLLCLTGWIWMVNSIQE